MFEVVDEFEKAVAEFFGAPYAVAVDSCTHGLELSLRLEKANIINVPHRTYLSVPFLADKLGIYRRWINHVWEDYYYLTPTIADAAVLWKKDSYVPGTKMALSFQFQKHLSLGRGGMILLDDESDYNDLIKMSYDGRARGVPWRKQNVNSRGYHYYMTPETAATGLRKLPLAIQTPPRKWQYTDWPDLTEMDIFK